MSDIPTGIPWPKNAAFEIALSLEAEAGIRKHAEESYPEECCGSLLGQIDGDGVRRVTGFLPAGNTKEENRERRFLIEPKAIMLAERKADALGLDVLGIYHSHPDHPSSASEFDRDHAMPFWSYVIVACAKGKTTSIQSFRLKDDRSAFEEESLLSNTQDG